MERILYLMEEGKKIFKVVFVRHGESSWNKENRFTGWTDVPLAESGIAEGKDAGKKFKEEGYGFDICFTSILKRAIMTWNLIADEIDHHYIPVIKSWRLNERHYGALQGLNKSETAKKHGEEQVLIWRRSYDIPPPDLKPEEAVTDPKFKSLPPGVVPLSESLKTTLDRVIPFWYDEIAPAILSGKRVIVAAHGNSIRAIVKHLDNVPEKEIVELNIPTGIPLIYELDEQLKPIKHYYLASEEEVKAKVAAVKAQGAAK